MLAELTHLTQMLKLKTHGAPKAEQRAYVTREINKRIKEPKELISCHNTHILRIQKNLVCWKTQLNLILI